jgi:hypothetical protein
MQIANNIRNEIIKKKLASTLCSRPFSKCKCYYLPRVFTLQFLRKQPIEPGRNCLSIYVATEFEYLEIHQMPPMSIYIFWWRERSRLAVFR